MRDSNSRLQATNIKTFNFNKLTLQQVLALYQNFVLLIWNLEAKPTNLIPIRKLDASKLADRPLMRCSETTQAAPTQSTADNTKRHYLSKAHIKIKLVSYC